MTIYRLIHDGAINSTRVSRSIWIYADSWNAYLTKKPTAGETGAAAPTRVTEPGQPPGNEKQHDFPSLIPVFRSP